MEIEWIMGWNYVLFYGLFVQDDYLGGHQWKRKKRERREETEKGQVRKEEEGQVRK